MRTKFARLCLETRFVGPRPSETEPVKESETADMKQISAMQDDDDPRRSQPAEARMVLSDRA
jgi:hypothetical protein